MFEVGLIERVDFLAFAGFLVALPLLAAGRLVAGLVAALPTEARFDEGAPAVVTLRELSRRSPRVLEFSLEPKAARTVATASSSESWRVSTITFMGSSWVWVAMSSGSA